MDWVKMCLVGILFGTSIAVVGCSGDDDPGDADSDSSTKGEDVGVDSGVDSGVATDVASPDGFVTEGVAEILPLEDFDDGDITNAVGGFWLAYDDGFDNGDSVVWPLTIYEDGVFESSTPGYGDVGHAAHVTGTTGGVLGWDYLGFATTLHPDALCPNPTPTDIDMNYYDGVQFMAKGGVSTGPIYFKVPYNKEGQEDACPEGYIASDSVNEYCDYQFDFKKQLSEEWSLVRVRFNELAQEDWGPQVKLREVLDHAKELVWEYKAQYGEVDIWIDNIALFKDIPEPAGTYPKTVISDTQTLTLWDDPEDPAVGTMTDLPVTGQPFDMAKAVQVNAEPRMLWDVMAYATSEAPIHKEDIVHLELYAQCIEPPPGEESCRMHLVYERTEEPWDPSLIFPVTVGREWTTVSVPFYSAATYDSGNSWAAVYLGFPAQKVGIGGLTVKNYADTVPIESLSQTEVTYDGRALDAPWRAAASERIELHRKGDFSVLVVDGGGNPVPNAAVAVDMTQHHYGFGTAIDSEGIQKGFKDILRETYSEKVTEHFNYVVPENTLKWPALAGSWGTAMGMSLAEWTIDWALERDLLVRGHTLVWPGWGNIPNGIKRDYEKAITEEGQEVADAWLKAAVEEHIRTTTTTLAGKLAHWDLLNEPFDNYDLMDILGNDVMADWFRIAKEADPAAKLFINDYSILARKITNSASRNNLYQVVESLIAADAPIDGIGFQGHFDADLTDPDDLYEILEMFSVFDKEIWITEFDMAAFDATLQADYTRDFLTMIFSHPATAGFVTWGFWDGAHYGQNGLIYDLNWNEKPSGAVFRDLVKNQWWTNATGVTTADGRYTTRGFFGDYTVTVTAGDKVQTVDAAFIPGSMELVVTLL